MPVHYQFSFCDSDGTQFALLAGSDGGQWHSVAYDHIENGVGRATLQVDGRLDFLDDITDRTILKIKRKVVRGSTIVDWYDEWEGMLDYIDDSTRNDVNTVRLEFASYLTLITARDVQYNQQTTYSMKTGNGETVIKELVEENAGPSATSPPRYIDGTTTGLTVEADAGNGNPWIGEHAGVPLLEAITKIANGTGVFFDVIRTGAAAFEFRVYHPQRGLNLSHVGVDFTTGGLNAFGNAPIVFSLVNQNMENPSSKTNYRDAISAVTMIGMGTDNDTIYRVRANAFDEARSPWSRRERIFRASAEYQGDALLYAANAEVIANRVKTTLDFDVVQVDSCLYGSDYTWGDVVTAVYKDVEYTKRISSVGVQVVGNNETIMPVMLDVAG